MRACADFRAQMIAHVRGELLPLERAHIESHIARCRGCASLEKKCARGLEAVDGWKANGEAAHLDRLKKRLRPYVADSRPVRASLVRIGGLGFAAAAAVVLAVIFVRSSSPVAPVEAPVIAEVQSAAAREEIAAPAPSSASPAIAEAVVRRAIEEHLHVIAGRGWDGHVSKSAPNDLRVEMQKGFAVMAFKGGEGRKLTVVAPNVEIEVIGTKFFVNVLANGTTAVGVVSGRVRVHHARGSELVDGGTSRAYGEGSLPPMPAPASATPAIDLDDAFIADHGHGEQAMLEPALGSAEPAAVEKSAALAKPEKAIEIAKTAEFANSEKPAELAKIEAPASAENSANSEKSASSENPTNSEKSANSESSENSANSEKSAEPAIAEKSPVPESPSVAELLAQAERLVAAGNVDDALHVYEGALASEDDAIHAHRPLFRYELARLLGFEKREVARARDIFERLAISADGEVRTQSSFALCELDLVSDACRAASCLHAIAGDASSSPSVVREANGLVARWKLENCDHK